MEENEKKAQELYMEFQVIEKHIKQMQRQLEALTSQLMELHATGNSLDEFNKIKVGTDILVPLSSGIFVKANIKDNSEFLINVGANVAVTKNTASAKRLIQNQIEELKKVQKQMIGELENMTSRAAQLEMQLQSLVS